MKQLMREWRGLTVSSTVLFICICVLAQPAEQSFGKDQRLSPIKPKYDHYENDIFLDDPMTADKKRRMSLGNMKIGTEPRVSTDFNNICGLTFFFCAADG